MFKKILIANRGEIACRVIKTAKKIGISTVAIYSEADANSPHVFMADEAALVGPSPVNESYLKIDKILSIAKEFNVDAIHPGYGFLSENASFAEALYDSGITFIGPSSRAIKLMGDKIESKKIAQASGVNIIPGNAKALDGVDEAIKVAKSIGYPIMVKAAAGGGGKGMRLAHSESELSAGVQSAINEAESSFGDGRVFIEKFIEQPRHIEIQVLADNHGNIIHLGERECSIQRRHQKIIEEAPSCFLDTQTREAMGKQACALAKAVNYTSTGTVEFVVDQDKNFFFLEMNTRLQVEHPVTELVTGIDLVEQQIHIANGGRLEINQADISSKGWAIEARVYAEDPTRGFTPSIGRLIRHDPPEQTKVIRVDTGVREGSEISMFYDPMISKLIAFGENREIAINNMLDALNIYRISGISHNLNLLSAVINHKRFREGNLTTAFMEDEFLGGFPAPELNQEVLLKILSISGLISISTPGMTNYHSFDNKSYVDIVVFIGDEKYPISIDAKSINHAFIKLEGQNKPLEIVSEWCRHQKLFKAEIDGEAIECQVWLHGLKFQLSYREFILPIVVRTSRASELISRMPKKQRPDLSRYLLSPMPGLLVAIPVVEGQKVTVGQALAVVDAMKMENVLKAERDGVVKTIEVKEGKNLAVDQIIMEFE